MKFGTALLSTLALLLSWLPNAVAQSAGCTLIGEQPMPSHLKIFAAETGDLEIAHFTGAKSVLTLKQAPSPGKPRAKIRTGSGMGNVAVEGFVDAASLPLTARTSLTVVPSHVWIAAGTRVVALDAAPNRLKVEARLMQPISQVFTTWTACDTVTLNGATRPSWTVPGEARGHLMNKDRIELFDDSGAGRQVIWGLERASFGDGVLFWSETRINGMAQISYHGEVILEAWAKLVDLKALPPGETLDATPPSAIVTTTQLKVPGTPKVVRVANAILLRSGASATAPVIGLVEPQTQVYLIDIVAGWASILPTSLNVAPPGDQQFWVEKASLGQ